MFQIKNRFVFCIEAFGLLRRQFPLVFALANLETCFPNGSSKKIEIFVAPHSLLPRFTQDHFTLWAILYFHRFNKQFTLNNYSIIIAGDWIRTEVLWYQKLPNCDATTVRFVRQKYFFKSKTDQLTAKTHC